MGSTQTQDSIRDFGIFGTYSADVRYRQDAIAAEISQHVLVSPSRWHALRDRIGTLMIVWGTRLEGKSPKTEAVTEKLSYQ